MAGALIALLSFAACNQTGFAAPANPSGFAIQRGVNLSHWLSQDFGWVAKEKWITRNDFRYIASLGFDHVRLPVDEIELWREDGSPVEANFDLLLKALEWAKEFDLRVIVDLHSVRAHHFNASNEGGHNTLWTDQAAQDNFLNLWEQLSERLKRYPVDFLAYEIMNEPTAEDPEDWNKLVNRSLEFIRTVEPDRVIVIGANMWQIPQMMPHLKVPEGDRNIILSMHTYVPLMFTHHKANWVQEPIRGYEGSVRYPGAIVEKSYFEAALKNCPPNALDFAGNALEEWGPERFAKEFAPAIERAKELNLQLYCGEFGCLPTVPRADRLAYYRDIVAVFEANGMAWANWEYKGDFGIFEWQGLDGLNGAPDLQLIDALMQK
ncbi:MAG: cellulase family glycosylhydrolase [Opitutales bacterium]|nr:cellulase family glycosylhydrolase [Opitutales bacterium]